MKHFLWMIFLICQVVILLGLKDATAVTPMVERHLFLPSAPSTGSAKAKVQSKTHKQIQQRIVFTGTIMTKTGRMALVRDKKDPETMKGRALKLMAGDSIMDFSIDEVGTNYLVMISGKEKVRLNLYQDNKKRPAAPPEPVVKPQVQPAIAKSSTVAAKAAAGEAKAKTPGVKPGITSAINAKKPVTPPANYTKESNPLMDAIRKGAQSGNSTATPAANNPFMKLIQQSMENK